MVPEDRADPDHVEGFLSAAECGSVQDLEKAWVMLGSPDVNSIYDICTGQRAVHLASAGGHLKVLQWLRDHHAALSITDFDGCTPAHHAAVEGSVDVLEWLTLCNEDINCVDANGLTPLKYAMLRGQQFVVNWLHAHLDHDVTDRPEPEALSLTRQEHHIEALYSPNYVPVQDLWSDVESVFFYTGTVLREQTQLPWTSLPPQGSVYVLYTNAPVMLVAGMMHIGGEYQMGCNSFGKLHLNRHTRNIQTQDGSMAIEMQEYVGMSCNWTLQVFESLSNQWKILRLSESPDDVFDSVGAVRAGGDWRQARAMLTKESGMPIGASASFNLSSCPVYMKHILMRTPVSELRASTDLVHASLEKVSHLRFFLALIRQLRDKVIYLQRFTRRMLARKSEAVQMLLNQWNMWQTTAVSQLRDRIAAVRKQQMDPGRLQGDLKAIQLTEKQKLAVIEKMYAERRRQFHHRNRVWEFALVSPTSSEATAAAMWALPYSYHLDLAEVLHNAFSQQGEPLVQQFPPVEPCETLKKRSSLQSLGTSSTKSLSNASLLRPVSFRDSTGSTLSGGSFFGSVPGSSHSMSFASLLDGACTPRSPTLRIHHDLTSPRKYRKSVAMITGGQWTPGFDSMAKRAITTPTSSAPPTPTMENLSTSSCSLPPSPSTGSHPDPRPAPAVKPKKKAWRKVGRVIQVLQLKKHAASGKKSDSQPATPNLAATPDGPASNSKQGVKKKVTVATTTSPTPGTWPFTPSNVIPMPPSPALSALSATRRETRRMSFLTNFNNNFEDSVEGEFQQLKDLVEEAEKRLIPKPPTEPSGGRRDTRQASRKVRDRRVSRIPRLTRMLASNYNKF